jgi:hypothetical protein
MTEHQTTGLFVEHIDTNDTDDKIFNDIYLNTIINWVNIRQNSTVMDVLDMNKNTMCIKLKNENPMMRDSSIQSYVLSLLIYMFWSICTNFSNNHYQLHQTSSDTEIAIEQNIREGESVETQYRKQNKNQCVPDLDID